MNVFRRIPAGFAYDDGVAFLHPFQHRAGRYRVFVALPSERKSVPER
jgi:hypothetical protein